MDKLIFLYDELMIKELQEFLNIPTTFITYGQMNGWLYWVKTLKHLMGRKHDIKKRLFAIPKNTTRVIYGGIFLIKNWEFQCKKVHAFYHNSIPNNGATLKEDLYDIVEIGIRPIKFKRLTDLENSRYEVGNEIMCSTFIGNIGNPLILRNSHRKYYIVGKLDKNSFIQMVKDNNERKGETKNGME